MENPTATVQSQWDSIQKRTEKCNAVREAIEKLDIAWHDINVTLIYFKEHAALDDTFKHQCETFQSVLGEKSDKYEQWLKKEQVKIDELVAKLEGKS